MKRLLYFPFSQFISDLLNCVSNIYASSSCMREIKFYISRSGDSSRLGWSQWGESRHGDCPHPESDDANLGVLGTSSNVWCQDLKPQVPRYKCADISDGFVEESLPAAGPPPRSQPQPVRGSVRSASGCPAPVCQAADWGRGQEWGGWSCRQEEIPGGRLSHLSPLLCRFGIKSCKIPEIFVSDWWTKGAKLWKPTWSLG